MMLSEVGVDIAPIVASAGIIGVALGFGSQTLVKDFLSGIFMIFEDQYGVGDVVDLGEASGTVEAVSLRVTRLRDVDGTVWYVRNGEILRVGNMSQNWARTVLDVNVGYDEDLAKVRRVLREIAHDLWDDEEFRNQIIEEPEVWGVQNIGVDGVTVRVTLKTAPMEQWSVAREMRERVLARFGYEGIEIHNPQRLLWHSEGAGGRGRPGRGRAAPAQWRRDHVLRRHRRLRDPAAHRRAVLRGRRARTRCSARSTPRRTSARRRSASCCSWCSTGAARRRTPSTRGHPRLRMRHAPFAVTPEAKDHWLMHFRDGLDAVELTPEQDAQFWDYVTHAAQFMVNTLE